MVRGVAPDGVCVIVTVIPAFTRRAQPTCNSGAAWFINKKLMQANYDYEFSVDIKNKDNDDSGVVFRFQDKNNFIRFHHTAQHVYNKNAKSGVWANEGCTSSIGSYLVVRKGGREYCAKKTTWKYTQNRYHSLKVSTKTDGSIKIWIDGKLHIDSKARVLKSIRVYGDSVVGVHIQSTDLCNVIGVLRNRVRVDFYCGTCLQLPSQWNQNVGTFGLFVAYSQVGILASDSC